METFLKTAKKYIPKWLFSTLQPVYHFLLAWFGAVRFGFPSRELYVVGVTGTKGKTTTTELIAAILEEAGYRVALANTNHLRIGHECETNLTKRSMLGRTLLQRFFRRAVTADCTHAVIEMTSEGAKQFRHISIDLDALIFTNLSPEHIESHGSYAKYVDAKVSLARHLEKGDRTKHTIVANVDDPEAEKFLAVRVGTKCRYRLADASPYETSPKGGDFIWRETPIHLQLPGEFNIMNALAAATFAESYGITPDVIASALEKFKLVPGRMESIDEGQPFTVIIDYAHTADSLDRAYTVYKGYHIIGILGGTGGGRDVAKRAVMGTVADTHCAYIILTTEDPYDESPRTIADDVAHGITHHPYDYIEDRRLAMRKAFDMAPEGSVVIITGKGAGPYIMGPQGTRIPWSDSGVAREELKRYMAKS